MIISLIAAIADNGVIGRDNTLPWHLPADLKYFKKVTMGHPIIMGRKNFADIGRPLPGRHNIILSRDLSFNADGCTVAHNPKEALAAAGDAKEVFVIGGAEVYRIFLPLADRLLITQVHINADGDIRFPDYDQHEWVLEGQQDFAADDINKLDYSFLVYRRPSK
ncbi:MAG: dihydrofolate reductase [Acidiferrobacterales bacterium]|nr:dihydrofolate reductase [Acidiferrobacterales bacterium]